MNSLRPANPPTRTLGEVAGFLGASALGESRIALTGLTLASGAVVPGDLFAAMPGANAHGAQFALAAMRAGARAVLTDDAGLSLLDPEIPRLAIPAPRERLGSLAAWMYGYPARDLTVVGVTGTTGKTTVTWLIEAAMREAWGSAALLGTVATRIGGEAIASARTTLEAPDLHAAFARMRERAVAGCAMEISSHALALHRVDGLVCDVAVLTNLARDHLDFHGTVEQYHAAKAMLFAPGHARRGVAWVDGREGERLVDAANVPIVRVGPAGVTAGAGVPPPDWQVEPRGPVSVDGRPAEGFRLTGPAVVEGATQLIGGFNVVNAALALGVAINLGIDPEVAARGIARLEAVPGRMDPVFGPNPSPLAVVDFAHTPDAIAAALAALRGRTSGRIIAVLGAGGGRDQGKRPLMGEAAAQGADLVIVTDDNPRDEPPAGIRADVVAGAVGGAPGAQGTVFEIPDRAGAIRAAVFAAEVEDTVAILGKGHETGQTIAGETRAFDDRTVLAEAMGEHGPWT
ncbi:MAG: UDP-N-acetylmuramoyl-L-alanyl-D-glutamate--2,6-diaminopimelate ligase [Bifidobacteriaceae bacterium]|jgi:UDP-N-acetylmuramoyl-L-alanyl-D-glutamate--2,6-diaminopimelate ligase|nr:UDP-N-acetylmuramoyl-L-alanyl-D-glutamate--2,6-diaminopimelate ligase [Bifidobacteriaceae bacterium]